MIYTHKNTSVQEEQEVVYSNYNIEFFIRQQKNFENCLIDNEIVVRPEKLVTLCQTKVMDIRQFVFE